MTKALIAIAVLLLTLLVAPLLGTFIGTIIGAVVGFVYPNTFAAVFTAAGFPALAALPLWQIGGVLGFIGGFFRSHLKQSDK